MAKLWLHFSAVRNFLSLPNDPSKPLTRFDLLRLKNWMLVGIFLSNIVAKNPDTEIQGHHIERFIK